MNEVSQETMMFKRRKNNWMFTETIKSISLH